jgi:hypothetical protein
MRAAMTELYAPLQGKKEMRQPLVPYATALPRAGKGRNSRSEFRVRGRLNMREGNVDNDALMNCAGGSKS